MAVHDAYAAGRGHDGAIEEFVDGVAGFFDVLADHVDFLMYGRQLRRWAVTHVAGQCAACRLRAALRSRCPSPTCIFMVPASTSIPPSIACAVIAQLASAASELPQVLVSAKSPVHPSRQCR